MPPRILFLFVDGAGLAPAGPLNPLSELPAPALRTLLGGPLTREQIQGQADLLLIPLDATLGVPGLPQSATGQTALFTGVNGAAILGHHATAYPGPQLRDVIAEHSLFKRALARQHTATFANPYTLGYWEKIARGERRPSVTTCAVEAAGLRFRGLADLRAGRAVTWDILRDHFAAAVGEQLPPVTAQQAGRELAGLAAEHDLTVYETFLPDLAGHHRFGITAEEAILRVDGLLGGVLAARPPDVTVVLCSDHGNIEDSSHKVHTLNPVPLLAVGPQANRFASLTSILEVTPAILACLDGPVRPS